MSTNVNPKSLMPNRSAPFTAPLFSLLTLLLPILPFIYYLPSADPAGLPRLLMIQVVVTFGILFFVWYGHWRIFPKRVLIPLILFVLWMLVCLLRAVDKQAALLELLAQVTFVQIFFIAGLAARDRAGIKRLLLLFTLSGAVVALIGAAQVCGFEIPPFEQRFAPASTFVNRNIFAEFILTLFPVSFLLTLFERNRLLGWLNAIVFGLIIFVLIAAQSRAVWLAGLGTLICLLLWLGLSGRFRDVPRWLILSRFACAALVVFLLFPPKGHLGISGRGQLSAELASLGKMGLNEDERLNTVQVRFALYSNSFYMFMEQPVFGVGPGNFPAHYPRYHDRVRATPSYHLNTVPQFLHNDLMQNFVELGLPGGLLFLWFLYGLGRTAIERLRDARDDSERLIRSVLLFSMLAVLAVSMVTFILRMPVTGMLFWLFAGFACAGPAPEMESEPGSQLEKPTSAILLGVNLLILFLYAKGVMAGTLYLKSAHELQAGRPEPSFAIAMQAFELHALDWRVLDELVALAGNFSKDRTQALSFADAFLARRPFSPNGHYRRAYILNTLRRPQEALEAVNRALEYTGENAECLGLRAVLYRQLGREFEALNDEQVLATRHDWYIFPHEAVQQLTIP